MTTLASTLPTVLDDRSPGERYYRHPGDVVRVVVSATVAIALVAFIEIATGTSDGIRSDLGRAVGAVPDAARQLALALVQVGAMLAPVATVVVLVVQRRWRRLAVVTVAALMGALLVVALDALISLPAPSEPGVEGTGLIARTFPDLAYLSGAAAGLTVAKPWLARAWRSALDAAVIALGVAMAVASIAGVPEVLLAGASGALAGAALLVAFGAPNRRPSPAAVANGLVEAGVPIHELQLERAVGGRAQLYRAALADGSAVFVKVYGHDSRDADLLYRGYRRLVLRTASNEWPAPSLRREVEHESLLLLLAGRGGVRTPGLRAVTELADGSMALAIDYVEGRRLDTLERDDIDRELQDALWAQVAHLHRARLAHRALRAANVLVTAQGPVLIDFGAGASSAGEREQAIDRAELLASLAALVDPDAAVASAAGVLDPSELAAATPYLQPLALSAATRRSTSKRALDSLRRAIATTTGESPMPLETLVRVRPRTVVTIVTLAGAFYVLLPQLANVDDSLQALRSANWAWMAGSLVMSLFTYVFSGIALAGGVRSRVPLVPTVVTQLASSFVNRVTPANVGGMALNVRFLQKAGVDPAEAVTAMGLDVVAGGIVHIVLLLVFFAWAGRGGASAFSLPTSSRTLVIIAVVLAIIGLAIATRWGRRVFARYVVRALKQSLASIAAVARSPGKLGALFGGSAGVTLSYIAALAAAMAAFDADVTFAQVGAVYLGSSIIAAAAPTPGGLGAMEAALVAGFTGVGLDAAIAVAAVLSYRVATFWLPILPGWLAIRTLERRNYI